MTYRKLLSLSIDDFQSKEDLSLNEISLYFYNKCKALFLYDYEKHIDMIRKACYSFEPYFEKVSESLGKLVKYDNSEEDDFLIDYIEMFACISLWAMVILEDKEEMQLDNTLVIQTFLLILRILFSSYNVLQSNGYDLSELMKA